MNKLIEQNKEWIDSTWEKLDKKLSRTAISSRNKIPYTTVNGIHDDWSQQNKISWWTNGFWGGTMWLMYRGTGKNEYRITAEHQESIMDGALKNFDELHHDVGFMWHLLCGARYKLTGNLEARTKNLFLACTLAGRYNIDGKYIRAWNHEAGFSIIDCLMNISLLYWASEQIGDSRYKKIAMSHMDMANRDHIRPDGSVNHIVDHDTETGAIKQILAGQGYTNTSCWSRGAAWAVYGTVISYIHTGKQEYLDAAIKTSDYFIENCKKTDWLPLCDFNQPAEPVYYDSTAGVCAACGMIELSKRVPDGDKYLEAAINILKATDKNWCNYEENEDAIVMMGTERYPHNEIDKKGLHIPIIYGDFFFVEALLKLRGDDFFIW